MIKDYANKLLGYYEGIDEFYACDYYKNKYLPLFEHNKGSCDTVHLVHRKLLRGACDMETPEYAELIKLIQGDCYIAPPEPGPLRKAYDLYNQGKYKEAIKYFEIFINKTDDEAKKAKYLFVIAKIYYRDLNNFPKSRKYALKAVSFRSGWGEPFVLIGKLYASSGPICGPGRGWDSQIVTWPAIDKFKYAKKIDSSVSKEANKFIKSYQRFMPSTEDIFQRTLKEGDKFKVDCWINETTLIRAVKKN
jgi:tetratricopeptide (TPR) repeat protein